MMQKHFQTLETQLRQNEFLYHQAHDVFGGSARVFRHYDPSNEMSIDILTEQDTPQTGTLSCATLGMMHYPVGLREGGKPLRFELAGACKGPNENFPDLLSRCAIAVMGTKIRCFDGAVLPDIVRTYIPESRLPHLLFTEFSFWSERLEAVAFEPFNVRWLTAIFLSDKESDYCAQHGVISLLSLFKEQQADLSDPLRSSVL